MVIIQSEVVDARGREVSAFNQKPIVWSKRDSAKITPVMALGVDVRADAGLNPDGSPFAPLKADTRRRHKQLGLGTLSRSGAMRASVEEVPLKRAAELRWRSPVTSRGYAIALLHQNGTKRMPARQLSGFDEVLAEEVTDESFAILSRNVKSFGRGVRDNTADAADKFDTAGQSFLDGESGGGDGVL